MERRLAAILSADVVGYSRLMETDEEATFRVLGERRQVIDELVTNHHGRVFGSAGDSVIAEFTSAVEAVWYFAERDGGSRGQRPLDHGIIHGCSSIPWVSRNAEAKGPAIKLAVQRVC